MKPTPILNGLINALIHAPETPRAFLLNAEAFAAVREEIMTILEIAKERDDLEMAERFTPVWHNGKEYAALMGVPFILNESVSVGGRTDVVVHSPSMN